MQFRLVYRGKLPAETNSPKTKQKHEIRHALHPQLKELWSANRVLQEIVNLGSTWIERLADENKFVSKSNHIHHFAPLVTKANYNGCSLDILFLRRDMPGSIIKYGGDIDNRLKVLFDALRMPKEVQELEDAPQGSNDNPLFCLLADDSFIDRVSVTTDQLLTPKEDTEAINDVVLIIHVTIGFYDPRIHFAPV